MIMRKLVLVGLQETLHHPLVQLRKLASWTHMAMWCDFL